MTPAEGSGRNPVLEVRRQLSTAGGPITYKVGELVESLTTGLAKHAAKLTPVLGVIIGFENANGGLIRPAQPVAGTASVGSIEQVTVNGSDVVFAIINASKDAKWVTPVNGTLGSTNSSDKPSVRIDIDSDNSNWLRALESTAVRTAGAKSNLVSHGVNPDDTTQLICSILNSELDSPNA